MQKATYIHVQTHVCVCRNEGKVMAAKKLTLEESFAELDVIISEMQEGELTLEETFAKYNKGMKLIKNCNDAIDRVEKKLIVLTENGDKV